MDLEETQVVCAEQHDWEVRSSHRLS